MSTLSNKIAEAAKKKPTKKRLQSETRTDAMLKKKLLHPEKSNVSIN